MRARVAPAGERAGGEAPREVGPDDPVAARWPRASGTGSRRPAGEVRAGPERASCGARCAAALGREMVQRRAVRAMGPEQPHARRGPERPHVAAAHGPAEQAGSIVPGGSRNSRLAPVLRPRWQVNRSPIDRMVAPEPRRRARAPRPPRGSTGHAAARVRDLRRSPRRPARRRRARCARDARPAGGAFRATSASGIDRRVEGGVRPAREIRHVNQGRRRRERVTRRGPVTRGGELGRNQQRDDAAGRGQLHARARGTRRPGRAGGRTRAPAPRHQR